LELIPDLGSGEASVIALALENKGSLAIIDDSLGRSVASSQKIKLTGTLGVLLLAKQEGLIPSLSSLVADLRKKGFIAARSLLTIYCELQIKLHKIIQTQILFCSKIKLTANDIVSVKLV
jgi:predicted nucleic acid-binding protein